jgi:dihydrofolate reductase
MRRIIASTYTTLDGYIDSPHEWSLQYNDPGALQYALDLTLGADALLLGRATYEGMAQAWPHMGGNPYADHVNGMDKYVVASEPVDTRGWGPTTVVPGDDLLSAVKQLKGFVGSDILIWGNGRLTDALASWTARRVPAVDLPGPHRRWRAVVPPRQPHRPRAHRHHDVRLGRRGPDLPHRPEVKENEMNSDVTTYLAKTKPWQTVLCAGLRETVHRTLPGVEEALQYGKPHFNLAGRNVAVLHVAAAKVSFMVFDASDVEPVPGLLRSLGSGDRKVVDIGESDSIDLDFIADLLRRTTGQN